MRFKGLLVIPLLTLFVIGIGAWGLDHVNKQAGASQNALEASYQNNFFSMVENFENLDVLLSKLLASNSTDRDIISLVTVWSTAEIAKTNLNNLPVNTHEMMRSNQYLAQLGDFCYSLAQKIAGGQSITESDWQKIKQLHEENRTIHSELRSMLGLLQDKQIKLGNLKRLRTGGKLSPDNQKLLDGFGKLDERLQNEAPTLTYDGPFSDHVVNHKPSGLTGQMIDDKEAAKIALKFAENLNVNNRYTAKLNGEATGKIPVYTVTLQSEDKDKSDLTLGISKKGGHVVLMIAAGEKAGIRRVDTLEAKNTAAEFVQKLDLGEFLSTGHLIEGNEMLVNFALLEDNIVIYPDMIQVVVSLENGNIAAFDANKYLLSHRERELSAPKITEAQAQAKVNERLAIEDIRLALIPLGNLDEKLTYEIKGKIDEDTYYVYINAENGFQEKILLIVETAQGSKSI